MGELESVSIPLVKKSVDAMQAGLNAAHLATRSMSRHPVDALQQRDAANSFVGRDLQFVRHVYGAGLAMRLATEQKVALQQAANSPWGIHCTDLYGEIVLGRDTKLEFSDFLSLPQNQPTFIKESPHLFMERQFRM